MRLLVLLALLLGSVSGASAQMRPHSRWYEIETRHFHIVFEAGLDSLAQHAGRRAEAHYDRLSRELSVPPVSKIDIIIGDNLDYTNGLATPIPSNRILLWAKPPVEDLALGYFNDWMDLVIAHELTHIFHLDRAGKIGRALRSVFGRVPWPWPFFPVAGTPDWTSEGLATYRESLHTAAGRALGTHHDMVLRTSVLESRLDPIDRVSGETPTWPAGQRAYIHGSMFMQYIADRLGADAHRQILNKTAGSILPPPFVIDRIARDALGTSFSQLYTEWTVLLQQRYRALADSLRAQGLTSSERMGGGERQAYHPRVSPDGRQLAWVEENGRNTTQIVVRDLQSGVVTRTRRNAVAPLAWLNNATIATTQLELVDPYTAFSDFYIQVNGDQRRMTFGERLENVDADRAGAKLLFITNNAGLTSIVQRDAYTGRQREIVPPRTDVQWVMARWSPDGSRIAAQRWNLGGTHDVVVMDTLGNEQITISAPQTINAAPTWTPDGKFVVFSSDRTGITNLYARDATVNDQRLFEITNILTGAFYPEVSPDGEYVYFSEYHARGHSIERMRLDPASWRTVESALQRPAIQAVVPDQDGASLPVERYSALRSVLPTYWLPVFQHDSVQGTYIGAFTSGNDDIDRHAWTAMLAVNFGNGRMIGGINYTYAGLGNPLLTLDASRETELLAGISVRREDNIALMATLLRPRWRSNLAVSAGIEGTVIKRDTMLAIVDAEDRFVGVTAGLSFGNFRTPAYAISPEDGVRAAIFARRRFDVDPVFNDDTYSELQGVGAWYRSIDAPGFAHHVVAARASGVYRTGLGIGPTDVGGVSDFLSVRGFDDGDRIGFRAWSASLEYRAPVAIIGRGYKLWPAFVDRVAASAFVDAGNADCTDAQRSVFAVCPGNESRGDELLLSAGMEVLGNVALLSFEPLWLRIGVAQPLQGPRNGTLLYFSLGRSF